MDRPRVAILDGLRTPLCKAGGVFRSVPADDLAAIVVRELLARTGIRPQAVSEARRARRKMSFRMRAVSASTPAPR